MTINRTISTKVNGKVVVPVNGAGSFIGVSGTTIFPQSLFNGGYRGAVYDTTVAGSLWQDTAATTPGAVGSVLKRIDDQTSNNYNATEDTNPPFFRTNSATCVGAYTLTADFSSSLGSNCTIGIAYPNGGSDIIWAQNIGSTYAITVAGVPILKQYQIGARGGNGSTRTEFMRAPVAEIVLFTCSLKEARFAALLSDAEGTLAAMGGVTLP